MMPVRARSTAVRLRGGAQLDGSRPTPAPEPVSAAGKGQWAPSVAGGRDSATARRWPTRGSHLETGTGPRVLMPLLLRIGEDELSRRPELRWLLGPGPW
jgi:hypothetical protein